MMIVKYNVLATWSLFNSDLVYVLDYDAQMARQIEKSPDVALKFAIELIRKCVFEEPAVAAPYDFVYSLEVLKLLILKPTMKRSRYYWMTSLCQTRAFKFKDAKNSQ